MEKYTFIRTLIISFIHRECLSLMPPYVHVLEYQENEEDLPEEEQIRLEEEREMNFRNILGEFCILPAKFLFVLLYIQTKDLKQKPLYRHCNC